MLTLTNVLMFISLQTFLGTPTSARSDGAHIPLSAMLIVVQLIYQVQHGVCIHCVAHT